MENKDRINSPLISQAGTLAGSDFEPSPDRASGRSPDRESGHSNSTETTSRSAREKVMSLLARRDHSEQELREKLAQEFSSTAIDDALAVAREKKWLLPPEELSAKVAHALGRKGKSHRAIQQYLLSKGLPLASKDLDEEVSKGRALLSTKLGSKFAREAHVANSLSPHDAIRARRVLANRGYDNEAIRAIFASIGLTTDELDYVSDDEPDAESSDRQD